MGHWRQSEKREGVGKDVGELYEHTVAAAPTRHPTLVPILPSLGSLCVHRSYPLTTFYCVLDGSYLSTYVGHFRQSEKREKVGGGGESETRTLLLLWVAKASLGL